MKAKMLFYLLTVIFLIDGMAEAGDVKISFDEVADADGYKVYVGVTYQDVFNKSVAPIDIGNWKSYCFSVRDDIPGFFVGVTAYNSQRESGFDKIAWILYGNVTGDYYDNIPYTSARVDGPDQAVIGQYFGRAVVHQYIDCTQEFVIQIPSLLQKADLNKDGRIDGKDLSILGRKWYKTLPP